MRIKLLEEPKKVDPRALTERLMKLVPCEPYKSGKKSRRVRKNRWVPADG